MKTHRITKGFDVRMAGKPDSRVDRLPDPLSCGLRPREFTGVKPKLLVKEGERVSTGDPLFADKRDLSLRWLSPATGIVRRIVLGERRFPELIEIGPEAEGRFADLPAPSVADLGRMPRGDVVAAVKHAGLWPLLRQRPFGKIADGSVVPTAIYINGMDTEPLAADPIVAVAGQGVALQLAVDLLRALSGGPVIVTVDGSRPVPREVQELKGVECHAFSGPHPAGLVGTHISAIAPLAPKQVVWYLKAQEAVLLGSWLASGRYPSDRLVAVAGTGAPQRQYFRVRQGASIMSLTGGKPLGGDVRIINGTVLSGTVVAPDGYLGFYANTVTVMPEGGDTRDMFGWALPQFGKLSASRAVLSWLAPKGEYNLDARLHGGPRHLVNIGQMDNMTPLDIHMPFLLRAIQANDVEEAVSLGLLELTEEDVSLCTFADPCKTEVGAIIRKGLDMVEMEG